MPKRQSRWDFWKFVEVKTLNECWPWKSAVSAAGHPRFGAEGKQWYVHRLIWEERNGSIADWPETLIMHLCNNPSCCNPNHLRAGTLAENMEHAGLSGNLARRGITNGRAKLTDEQVLAIKADLRGSRQVAKAYGIEKTQVLRIRKGIQR